MLLKNPVTQEPTRIIGVTADIQYRKEREEFFSHRATHDALTELPNRVFFDDHLKNSIEYAKRNGTHLAVIMVDLDNFKTVNDTLGHYAGDTLLVEVAQRLQKNLRESDMVSRFGGDEFAMILAFGKNEWQSITKVLNRTMASLKKPVALGGNEIVVSASFGISICPDDGDNPKQLMMRADEALYYAKASGRNACAFWKANQHYHIIRFEAGSIEK
jgi:diguanylate cyclase (GGDEF)-like protein